jgi:hypothetical protein
MPAFWRLALNGYDYFLPGRFPDIIVSHACMNEQFGLKSYLADTLHRQNACILEAGSERLRLFKIAAFIFSQFAV